MDRAHHDGWYIFYIFYIYYIYPGRYDEFRSKEKKRDIRSKMPYIIHYSLSFVMHSLTILAILANDYATTDMT